MPVIRVSNEAYRTLLRLQAEDGNTMSVFLDRFFAKHDPISKPVAKKTPKAKTTGKLFETPKVKKLTPEEERRKRRQAKMVKEIDDEFFKNHPEIKRA